MILDSVLEELRFLFRDMISSPNSSVTPGRELARLTLISPSNEGAIRRKSTISVEKPSSDGLGEINGKPVLGPVGPSQTNVNSGAGKTNDDTPQKGAALSDGDSEATLVSEGAGIDGSLSQPNDKENEPPYESELRSVEIPGAYPTNAESPTQRTPPPLPPRLQCHEEDRQKQLLEELEMGAQQDVTEVINNVLFQSQCAIKPLGFESDGEQVDMIKDLFYGKTQSYILARGGVRSKEERWCDIKVDVASGSRDIYSALDGAFDVQKINVENSVAEQFGSISRLPPVLQIQVQRVQFDPVTKRSFKSTQHLEVLQTIYLDRYMDTNQSDLINRRRQCWEWKSWLKQLEAHRSELLRTNVLKYISTNFNNILLTYFYTGE